jgi:hypothetical protein
MNKIDILKALVKLRDDLRSWVIINLQALNKKIEKKTSFSGNYQDLVDAPDMYEDESGEIAIADEQGNVILRVGSTGLKTTNITTGESSAPHRGILVGTAEPTANIGVDGDLYIMYEE